MLALFLIACVSLQTQSATLDNLSKGELELRTRGGVLKQRLANRQIRVLCEDEVMTTMADCKDYAFYLIRKEAKKNYSLQLLGEDLGVLDWKSAQERMNYATYYFRPHHDNGDILLLILACFFPPLIIPVAIAIAINDMGESIENARIRNLNDRLERFQRQAVESRDKTVRLNKKKFEMALTAFQRVLIAK
ncbi:MAG: hypothetical protein A2X86_17185 [Bdellovibrionales bacterium GWA2_49_15]|nr:MAG: hypothetical protein A2X86_17185 [Bdellovibrionales bacterium GWA2_49_15]HAZ14027.1 hypothetical protein [Bdellovibrionales bacterium]